MSDLLGIDLGTRAIKVGRCDETGRQVSLATNAYRQPDEDALPLGRIWEALAETAREVIDSTRDRGEVAGIGISSQVNSFALIGREGEPITDVFLWTGDWAQQAAVRINRQGNPASTIQAVGMSSLTGRQLLPKCAHLREQQPTVWRLARGIRQLADLVTHRLTGEHVTSASLWSPTGFYNLAGQNWWSAALERLHIEEDMLPRLAPTGSVAGRLAEEAARTLNLPAGIPVAVGTSDYLAGAISVANVTPHHASLSTETSMHGLVTHERRPPAMTNGLIGRHPADTNLWYALTWSSLSMTALSTCLDGTEEAPPASELLEYACHLPDEQAGWTARRADPKDVKAGFIYRPLAQAPSEPQSQPHTAQRLRAVVNLINVEIERLLDEARAGQHIESVAVTGEASRSEAWMRLLAYQLCLPVLRPEVPEACVRGAALCGGLAAGILPSLIEAPPDDCHTFPPTVPIRS